ncbi:serine-rich adhesin for platelets isoform X1 [Paralichthys olivaceus]|uniref:serine-rich adhesin for platelets isoform X1 n=1 Tax=Paralichthys olivaceus TaxID=8255 RepID=UPI0037521509
MRVTGGWIRKTDSSESLQGAERHVLFTVRIDPAAQLSGSELTSIPKAIQIVCPMDEDAIPHNPFCSAPPHSEPPPPLLPLSSVTPSCTNDEISGHRRSGRIQGNRAQTPKKQSTSDGEATPQTSRQSPSPGKRQRESGSMVQVSQSKQLKVECTHVYQKQNKDGFDISLAAEHQNSQKDQKSSWNEPKVSVAENVVEQVADNTTQNPDASKSDMGSWGGLAVEHAVEDVSAPKGWVIGPLFQSFKSKMASFTEIVMSPVKLFRANSPPLSMDHGADGTSDDELSNMFQPIGKSETGNQEDEVYQQRLSNEEVAQNVPTSSLKYSRKLMFDMNNSEEAEECAITLTEKNLPDSGPLQDIPGTCSVSKQVLESVGSVVRCSTLSQASLTLSASHESTLKTSSAVEVQGKQAVRPKPLLRKRTGNRSEFKKVISKPLTWEVKKEQSEPEVSDEQLSQRSSVQSNKAALTQLSSSSVCQLDTNSPQPDDNITNIESCSLERQSLFNNLNDSATGRTLKSTLETRQLESQINPDTDEAAGVGRSKRGLKLFQETVKRKKLKDYTCSDDIKNQKSLKVVAENGILRGLRPPRKEVGLMNTTVYGEETLKPLRKRQAASSRANRKGKVGQEMLPVINEAMSNTQMENSPDAMLVCSLDKSSCVSENHQNGSSRTKPSGSCKRLKTRSGYGKPDVNIDSMDLESTVAITSTRQGQLEPLSDVFIHPDKKQLQSKCRNTTKKPIKRKSPIQASSKTESDSTLVSNLSIQSVVPFELTPTDSKASPPIHREEILKTGLNRHSERPKKAYRGAVKSSESSETQESKQCFDNLHLITKDCQSKGDKGKSTVDPVYFEMTPFECNPQPDSSLAQSHLECFVQLNKRVKRFTDGGAKSPPVPDEVLLSPTEASNRCSVSVSRLRLSTGRVNIKPRRADNQRRRCRVLRSRTRKGEEMTNSITMEDADLVTGGTRSSENDFTRGLLRSYSCPEILSLHLCDTPWTTSVHSPHHSRTHSSHQHQSSQTPSVPHTNKFLRRARRHTVCSIEVEREIAPLCLRKEVYPSRRSAQYDSVNHFPCATLSPSTSLSVLASCFLSSPLAFLSKKVDSRGAAASPSTSCHISSPISSLLTSPVGSSTRHLPGFLQRSDSSLATLDSCISGNPLECETKRRQQSEEEDDGEDTSSSSHEYEDVGLREEKALSDSEIKVVQKREERGKVSSIRIRKTLPKPQNNLTPMGLPKPIRLKKKEFSLEEIYTNKNFSKPPESRLETIFEVPLNRRNGSESWFGQRRFKRFLEFLEVGEARKPKRPLVGVGKATSSSSRTRRGGFTKDEPSLSVQDVDSLLCAKLDQLKLWLIHDDERKTAASTSF